MLFIWSTETCSHRNRSQREERDGERTGNCGSQSVDLKIYTCNIEASKICTEFLNRLGISTYIQYSQSVDHYMLFQLG